MPKLTPKKLAFPTLILLGLSYFSAFSYLEIPLFLKGYLAVVPLQVGTLLYVLYLYWQGRLVRQKRSVNYRH